MNGLMESFMEELEILMKKYEVTELTYTINDDGIHAYGSDNRDWNIGWPHA